MTGDNADVRVKLQRGVVKNESRKCGEGKGVWRGRRECRMKEEKAREGVLSPVACERKTPPNERHHRKTPPQKNFAIMVYSFN